MKPLTYIIAPLLLLLSAIACSSDQSDPTPVTDPFALENVTIGGQSNLFTFSDTDPQEPIVLLFTTRLDPRTIEVNIRLEEDNQNTVPANYRYDSDRTIVITPTKELKSYGSYSLILQPDLLSHEGQKIASGKVITIATGLNRSDKFERIDDEALLTLVQQRTFRYFWDYGHPACGLARERTTSGDVVTTGGTGFGVMAMVVAAERGFVPRAEAAERVLKIVTFLSTRAARFHGAFPHWLNGATGDVQPFSADDNGADLVETALLMEGLLTARAYFEEANDTETTLRATISSLWEDVEWDFFTKEGTTKQLYWHWSPDKGWKMNMPISGWNECLIVYVLAAASPTHPITKEVYDAGWARHGALRNGGDFYGITLPLGSELGGPLFFSQYSFLGLNPKGLSDGYADYWQQNRNHTLINYNYCLANPKHHAGYSAECWGLTASDGDKGYNAWSPTNDTGVIAPTAALSAMPYTPTESMAALRFYYYKLGDKLWGDYGFIDAFNLSKGWFATGSHIAIDQGPIIVMIENHRTGLPWQLFMSDRDVSRGLTVLGFTSLP
ncbi:MAG: glucoamylase family protein [Alistipes sp.]